MKLKFGFLVFLMIIAVLFLACNRGKSEVSGTVNLPDGNETVIMPDQSYVGQWNTDRTPPDRLIIKEIGNSTITFDFEVYRLIFTSGTATIENNKIVFTDDEDGLSGTLLFNENSILMTIEKSIVPDIDAGAIFYFNDNVQPIAETGQDLSIYGVWRLVKMVDSNHGETSYIENGQMISIYHVEENNVILATTSGFTHGHIEYRGDNRFNLHTQGTPNVYAGPPIVYAYDPETKYLVEYDHTVELHYEWVQDAVANFEELSSPTIHIEFATDEILNKFDSWLFEYNDTSGDRFVLWTDTVIKNFEFISIGFEDSFVVNEVIYSFDEWSPEKAIHIQIYVPEGIPNLGISFIDENNIKRYYYIGWSGIDGSLLLINFSL